MISGPGLAVADEAGTEVVVAVMSVLGWSGVNPKESLTGTGICGVETVWDGPRRGNREGEGSRTNASARVSSVASAACIGRKGEVSGLSVVVTRIGEPYDGRGVGEAIVGIYP